MEFLGQHLDEDAEIHTLVGGIVEDGFRMVALELHVVHLHVQSQFRHNLTGAQQRLTLLLQGLGPAVDIGVFGATEELLHALRLGIDFALAHLQAAELAGEAHDTHIMAGLALHGHHITLHNLEAVGQTVEVLVVVLETHLHAVERTLRRLTDSRQPVGRRHLRAALELAVADGLVALRLAVAAAREEDGLLVFHPRDIGVGVEVGIQLALLAVVFLHLGVLTLHPRLLLLTGLAALTHKGCYILGRSHGLLAVEGRGLRFILQFFIFVFFHFKFHFSLTH